MANKVQLFSKTHLNPLQKRPSKSSLKHHSNDSIFNSKKYSSSASKYESSATLMTALAGIVGVGTSFAGLFSAIKSTKQQTSGDNNSKEASPSNKLDAAMKEATKTGDWSGVKAEYEAAQSQYQSTLASITESKGQVAEARKGIESLEAANQEIDDTKIPEAETLYNQTTTKAESDKNLTIASAEADYNKVMNDPNASQLDKADALAKFNKAKLQAETAYEKAKAEAKTNLERTKTQLKDQKTQNKVKIQEIRSNLDKLTQDIAKQTKDCADLQKTIQQAKSNLDLHTGETSGNKSAQPKLNFKG